MVDNEIVFSSKEKFKVQDWAEVRHLFVWERRSVVMIDNLGRVQQRSPKKGYKMGDYVRLWEEWAKHVKRNLACDRFEYPRWLRIQEIRRGCFISGFMMLGILIIILMFAFSLNDMLYPERSLYAIALFIFVNLMFFIGEMAGHISKKKLSEIHYCSESLKVTFADGKMREYSFEQVKNYNLDVATKYTYIRFKDGSYFRYLERLSYWPILREYLLSKLEPESSREE